MIDLHCHLIWGVDDGCQSEDDSLEMAKGLVKAGVHTVTCTPHLRHDKGWVNKRAENLGRLEDLKRLLDEQGVPLTVLGGTEHYLTPELFDHVAAGEHTPYSDSRSMLVEIPYSGPPPDMAGVLFRLRRQRITPVLAHVERYASVGVDLPQLRTLHEAGYPLQVNLGSLAGAYGRANEKQALRLLEAGLCHVMAGDCHGPEDPARLIEAGLKVLHKVVGAELGQLLTEGNPAAIIAGKPVQDMTD